jgi:hypothetical protein
MLRCLMFENLFLTDLSEPEESALCSYKSASDTADGRSKCFDLNRELRDGRRLEDLDDEFRAIARSLDSIFERCPRLTVEATVYRGVGQRHHFPPQQMGDTFKSLQYWSTTTLEDSTESFMIPNGRKARGAVLEMTLPAGFPAYNMESLEQFGSHEGEVLLPRGVLWEVADTRERKVTPFLEQYYEHIEHIRLKPLSWS